MDVHTLYLVGVDVVKHFAFPFMETVFCFFFFSDKPQKRCDWFTDHWRCLFAAEVVAYTPTQTLWRLVMAYCSIKSLLSA